LNFTPLKGKNKHKDFIIQEPTKENVKNDIQNLKYTLEALLNDLENSKN